MTRGRCAAAAASGALLLAGLAACGGDDHPGTLARDDVPGATADPEGATRIPDQVPCAELDQVEDDLVSRNDFTKEGGEVVTIEAGDDVVVDSSVWPAADPDDLLRDIAAAVTHCKSDDAGATYEGLSGPHGAIGYRAIVKTNPEETRIERFFVPLDGQVAIVGVYDPHAAASPLALDLVEPARQAATTAKQD